MLAITSIPIAILLCALGILFLYLGGESLVRGSAQTAFRLGIKPIFVGLIIVSYGTTLPEFGVSLLATLANHVEIAVGNAVGSTICNILLILGIGALIRPFKIEKEIVRREAPIMVLAILTLMILSFKLSLQRYDSVILLSFFVAYIVFFIWCAKKSKTDNYQVKAKPMWLNIIFILAGFGGVILGARLLLDSAVFIAYAVGIPETVIGLTLVAVGTSLPELAVSTVAAYRGHSDISVGNVIGANIFDVLWILGICSLVAPLLITPKMFINMFISLLTCGILIIMLYTGYRVSRIEGVVMLICYTVYLAYLYCL